ncbi:unnamed protein product, partial [Choristocarpus tenellus]
IKSFLSDQHELDRVTFFMSSILKKGMGYVLEPMLDCVHLDEKWFDLVSERRRVYIKPGEAPPKCPRIKSRSHVPKSDVSDCEHTRPRILEDGTWWDRKIGSWPLAEGVAARRSSSNHT